MMTRSASSIPTRAESLARDLVVRARRAAGEFKEHLFNLEQRDKSLRDDKHKIEHHSRMALNARDLSLEEQTQIRSRTEAELREWQARTEALAAERVALLTAQTEALSRADRLEKQYDSSEGLAPWDTAALEALRAWGELPAAARPAKAILRGSEVEALFRERLGVSRSTYYSEIRPWLRSYHLVPFRVERLSDGGALLHRSKNMRFRSEEVDALIAFIETGSAQRW